MSLFADLITLLGRNYILVVVGCIEVVAAVVLLGYIPRRRRRVKKQKADFSVSERLLLQELSEQKNEVCIALRRSDLMPTEVIGALEPLLGVTPSRLSEDVKSMLGCAKNHDDEAAFWKKYEAFDGGEPFEFQFETKDGLWLFLTAEQSRDKTTNLLIFRNITEEHKREEQYKRCLDDAEKASQFKTSFLFRMSHEIRTPMNGITGMIKLAKDSLQENHPAMQYLRRTDELSDHLLSLINDILDMSRIEAGKVELEEGVFSLKAFGDKLYNMFNKTLDAKGVKYNVNFESVTVDRVVGDELRIGQVVINFLSNAVKFTSEGEVTVTFRQMMKLEDSVDLMIKVHDTGIGMDPEFINRIFNPFEQEDTSTTRRYGGTGLGMAISDQLVKLMGGQIVVESLKGKGSDFSVFLTLPVAAGDTVETEEQKPEQEEKAKKPLPDKLSCRVLLAEDNEINAMITVEILGQKGVTVDVAENGKAAVDKFAACEQGTYDLILMDVQMPVMNGRDATKAIRALDRRDAKEIPIYALSADAFVEDERLSIESGMNGHLSKPIDYDALFGIIGQTIQKEVKDI